MKTLQALLAASIVVASASVARADPTAPECAAAAEKSTALRKEHKLRDARTELLVCAAASCPSVIRDECARRIPEVNTAMPTVVFEAKTDDGRDVSAVVVTIDGAKLADKLDGTALAMDPGEHKFAFEIEGHPRVERTFVIREGEKDRREKIVFAAPAGDATTTTAITPPPPTTPAAETPPPKTQRTIALVMGGVGAASLIAGAVLGTFATIKWNDAKNDCGAGCGPNDPAQGEKNTAQAAATGANITLIGGGVLLAAGVVLWLTAPHAQPSHAAFRITPTVGWNGAGLVFSGDL